MIKLERVFQVAQNVADEKDAAEKEAARVAAENAVREAAEKIRREAAEKAPRKYWKNIWVNGWNVP